MVAGNHSAHKYLQSCRDHGHARKDHHQRAHSNRDFAMAVLSILLLVSFYLGLLPLANAVSPACTSGIVGILQPLGKDAQVKSFCSSKYPVPPVTTTVIASTTTVVTDFTTSTSTSVPTVYATTTDTATTDTTTTVIVTSIATETQTSTAVITQVVTSTETTTVATVTVPSGGARKAKRASTTTKANPLSTILSQANSIISVFCTCIQTTKTVPVTSTSTATQRTTSTVVATTVAPTTISSTVHVTITNTKSATSTFPSTTTVTTTVTSTSTSTSTTTVSVTATATCPAAAPTTCASGGVTSCVNFSNDRRNCGGCGKACTGDDSCVNGVCKTPNSCNPSTQYCGGKTDNTCVCFRTQSGGGVCTKNGTVCVSIGCTSSQDCPNGSACTQLGCCLNPDDYNICPNPPPSRLFARKPPQSRRSGDTAAREVLDVLTGKTSVE